ncbi:hypothetical protein BP6252_13132 [Coleophoma cylindrospora]|uniref:Uncharacterized protein n=1 Tax=Coleophoma cylindrospora TaxID=1849047 RepID=A0A3D8QA05_9HELO|nr:hypothetical protein BP6252_13132 [Coleophoma cylindrospora]
MALQYQFDVIQASSISVQILKDLFAVCAAEDIQPLVFQSIETFGQWLMVDRSRLNESDSALVDSKSKRTQFESLFIGFSDRGLTKIIRDNMHLKAAFLFIAGCSIFNAQRTGRLIHEIMALRSDLKVSAYQICQLVERIKGHSDYLPWSPLHLYDQISDDFWIETSRQALSADDVYHDTEAYRLADLIYQIIEAVHDHTNERVVIKGSRTGIWLATLFVWLWPDEVDVWVQNDRIYPKVDQIEPRSGTLRLSVVFVEHPRPSDSHWSIQKWTRLENGMDPGDLTKVIMEMKEGTPRIHRVPLNTARREIASYVQPTALVKSIGYLAGALVILAVEKGGFGFKSKTSPLCLLTLCSTSFKNVYHKIMTWFGWKESDLEDVQMIEKIIECIGICVDDAALKCYSQITPLGCLELILIASAEAFQKKNGMPMLEDFDQEAARTQVIEHSIHLAAEALYFSLCETLPRNAMYRALEPHSLQKNATMLYALAFGRPRPSGTGRGIHKSWCNFWDFRCVAMHAILHAVDIVNPDDLVVSVDGYVAYQAAMENLQSRSTDRQVAATFCVRPGGLNLKGVPGKYRKLVERNESILLSNREANSQTYPIELFSSGGLFTGIDEGQALNKLDVSVDHLIRPSEGEPGILYMVTYLHERWKDTQRGLTKSRVPTSWEKSIYAIVHAQHITTGHSRPRQLEELAQQWHRENLLGETLQWCFVGKDVRPKRNHISTTRNQEELRFFEAGNLGSGGHVMYIRQGSIPLIHCVKEAMQLTDGWVIIA